MVAKRGHGNGDLCGFAPIDKPGGGLHFDVLGPKGASMDQAPVIGPADDPLVLFEKWFREASAREPLAEAMSLATVTSGGQPAVRMVLLKDHGPEGFAFYTNTQSRKGQEIAETSKAALCL